MSKWIEIIRQEWNAKIPHVPNNYEPTLIHIDKGMLMSRLLWEEWTELKTAKGDLEGGIIPIADALGDLSYLLYGMAAQYGLDPVWNGSDTGFDFDIPDTINELMVCVRSNNLKGIRESMKQLENLIRVEAVSYGLECEMDKIIDSVHQSNLTKLCDGELLVREDGKIMKNKETFKEPDFSFLDGFKIAS